MKLSTIAGFYYFLQVSVLYISVRGQCPGMSDAMPKIPNGYMASVSNITFSNNATYGYFDVQCNSGYDLDPAIGGRITCLSSGTWSKPLPQCNVVVLHVCSYADLSNFISTATTISINQSLSFIQINPANQSQALAGANITIQCLNGYKNVGGPLTIVCTNANSWTAFPNCVPNTESATPANTQAPNNANTPMAPPASTPAPTVANTPPAAAAPPAGCPVTGDTLTFTHGFAANAANIVINSDNTTTSTIMVSCEAGYDIDSVTNGVMNCNKGTWSSPPYCIKTGRCQLSVLNDDLNNATLTTGLAFVTQKLYINTKETDGGILENSYILFGCQDGYVNNDGNLKFICQANSQWSPFPICDPQSN